MACQEALTAGKAPVAREALQQLHALLMRRADERAAAAKAGAEANDAMGRGHECAGGADGAPQAQQGSASEVGGGGGEPDLPEGTVLRCLVRLGLDDLAAAAGAAAQPRQQSAMEEGGAAAAAGGEPSAAAAALHAALTRLGQWLHLASQRIAALGLEAFAGPGESHVGEHVSWLANAAWNAGLDAAGGRGPASLG